MDDNESYLIPRSEDTFLAQEKRYPFVGIIRIKIKCAFLEGRGSVLTRKIKTQIERMSASSGGEDKKMQIIIMDSYDNDELVVSSFSTCLYRIYDLVENIKNIKECEKHVIETCHVSYGIHIDFNMSGKSETFLAWESSIDRERCRVNMFVETKPGHQKKFRSCMKSGCLRFFDINPEDWEKEQLEPRVSITGGGKLIYELPLDILPWIYGEASSERDGWMYQNAVRIKLALSYKNEEEDCCETDCCPCQNSEALIEKTDIDKVKNNLAALGVSKTVRESVLSLFAFYNYCVNNRLQCYYIQKLKQSVLNIAKMTEEYFKPGNASVLEEIERTLNDEVKCLEIAICDRVNTDMEPNVVLEYVCGIQQILHGFGTTYHTISNILERNQTDPYSFIVAKAKESSTKTHVELNINHLIYPELFVTTVWKESSNFSFDDLVSLVTKVKDNKESESQYVDNILSFLSFLRNKRHQDELASHVYAKLMGDSNNQVCQHIMSLLHEDKLYLIKYVLSDAMVYHFAFQSDFSMMWNAYFNVFLQMSGNYSRPGKVMMKRLVFLLLRLFLVAYSDTDNINRNLDIVLDRISKPFDPILSGFWYLSYVKVMRASLSIYEFWNTGKEENPFCDAIDCLRYICEQKINPSSVKNMKTVLDEKERRNKRVMDLKRQLESFEVIIFDDRYTNRENVICVLNAYASAIHELSKTESSTIHHLLRNPEDGTIWSKKYVDDIIKQSSTILADPEGGFVIPDPEVRRNYFAYRTWLYRTLWDLSYDSKYNPDSSAPLQKLDQKTISPRS